LGKDTSVSQGSASTQKSQQVKKKKDRKEANCNKPKLQSQQEKNKWENHPEDQI